MGKHPNKYIREAIEYALTHGWDVIENYVMGGKMYDEYISFYNRCA